MTPKSTTLNIKPIPARARCRSGETIEHVAGRFTSSHAPLFVFDEEDTFEGLLSAKNILFKRRCNPKTSLNNHLIHPPQLRPDSSTHEVLSAMKSAELYALPIFDEGSNILGIVRLKDIVKTLLKNDVVASKLYETIDSPSVITLCEGATVGDAFKKFTKHNISRLIIVNHKGAAKGIVTKRDIISLFLTTANKQRFSSKNQPKTSSFDVEQMKRTDEPLSRFVSPLTSTFDEEMSMGSSINKLLSSPYNAIVLIDKTKKPKSVVSMNTIAKAALNITKKVPEFNVIMSHLPQKLYHSQIDAVHEQLYKLAVHINKQHVVQVMRLSAKESLSPKQKLNIIEVTLRVTTDDKTFVAAEKDRDFMKAIGGVVREIKTQLQHQTKRSPRRNSSWKNKK